MAGYKDMDELFRLTKKSFRNLIREDEQKKIEASVIRQIKRFLLRQIKTGFTEHLTMV